MPKEQRLEVIKSLISYNPWQGLLEFVKTSVEYAFREAKVGSHNRIHVGYTVDTIHR